MIDITMTATLRPEILEETLKSFRNNLFLSHDCRLIINVDRVGLQNITNQEIFNICRKYFKVYKFFSSDNPSFSKAFVRVWKNTSSEFVFNLEDDWCLLKHVDLAEMLYVMRENPDLAILRLPWKGTDSSFMKNWKYFFPYNSDYCFFECPGNLIHEVGFCGHPSLIRGSFIQNTVIYIDNECNPEKQFHHGNKKVKEEISKWRFGVFAKPLQNRVIKDIGREWMVNNNFKKSGNKAFFISWEEIK